MSTKDRPVVFEEPRLPVHLDGEEVYYLSDAIDLKDIAEGLDNKDAYIVLARDLLLLLGGAYIELVEPDRRPSSNSVPLMLTENQVWLLRSKVNSRVKASDQTTVIGVALLRKLYQTLLEFHSDLDGSDVAFEAPTDAIRWTPEMADKLKEHLDAATG